MQTGISPLSVWICFSSLLLLIFAACSDSDPGNAPEGMIGMVKGSPNHLWVGVAQVPLADDPLTNLMLGLPNDAICELPFTSTSTAENDPSAGCDE